MCVGLAAQVLRCCWLTSDAVYELDILHQFAKTFPHSPFTDFIDDYCRFFKLPLPEPEEVAESAGQAVDLDENGQPKPKPKKRTHNAKHRSAMNARERRKTRRLAGKEGVLAEDVDTEEREELVSSMTVSLKRSPINRD
jgi:superkiller protein 3